MGGRGGGGGGRGKAAGGGGAGGLLTVEQSIERVYNRLADRPGGWVSIADIRDELSHRIPRADLDAALRRIEQHPNANIVPESNQKALSDRERAGSIRIGGQDKHFISFFK